MFSCEFSKISKNTFFTEHLRTTASAFSFSEAATGGVLWKKVFLKISQENTFGLRNTYKEYITIFQILQIVRKWSQTEM